MANTKAIITMPAAKNYNFFITGMAACTIAADVSIVDPNGNTWTGTVKGNGTAFDLPNPLDSSNPFGWIPKDSPLSSLSFDVTITSTSGGSGEMEVLYSDNSNGYFATVMYNDSAGTLNDYNDVVLYISVYVNSLSTQGA